MKKLLLILTIAFNYAYAQNNELAIAKVHYMFKHINDTTQPENFLRDEVVTYIGQKGSYYTSYSSTRTSEYTEKMLKDPGFDGNLKIPRNTSPVKESYLLKRSENFFREIRKFIGADYVLEEGFPVQDWNIEDETREIGGYLCQKATTRFKGRDYTAWFTTELPFSYGPWKLHGLPGLILEAYDAKKEVVFEYSGFDKELEGKPVSIAIPENAHVVTVKEFKKQEDAFKANPQAYVDARLGGTSRKVSTSSGGNAAIRTVGTTVVGQGSSSVAENGVSGEVDPSKIKLVRFDKDVNYNPSKVTNNPIELAP